jgi:hypothetical protein
MAVEIAQKDRKAVPITWDVTLVQGEVVELWADNPADDEPLSMKKRVINDGSAHVAFPADYVGECNVQIKGENDSMDEGLLTIE